MIRFANILNADVRHAAEQARSLDQPRSLLRNFFDVPVKPSPVSQPAGIDFSKPADGWDAQSKNYDQSKNYYEQPNDQGDDYGRVRNRPRINRDGRWRGKQEIIPVPPRERNKRSPRFHQVEQLSPLETDSESI